MPSLNTVNFQTLSPKVAIAAVMLCFILLQPAAALSDAEFWATARDSAGDIVYREKHSQQYAADGSTLQTTTTEYFDAAGTLIAELRADYSRSISLPTYDFTDLRSGYREGLRYQNNAYSIFRQEQGKDEETTALSDTGDVYSCQGWHYYLVNNLQLLSDDDLVLKLVLPGLMNAYRFKISQTGSNGELIEARLQLNNWMLRMFAPKIRLVYDRSIGKLVEYQGVSNILDSEGNNQEVLLSYQY